MSVPVELNQIPNPESGFNSPVVKADYRGLSTALDAIPVGEKFNWEIAKKHPEILSLMNGNTELLTNSRIRRGQDNKVIALDVAAAHDQGQQPLFTKGVAFERGEDGQLKTVIFTESVREGESPTHSLTTYKIEVGDTNVVTEYAVQTGKDNFKAVKEGEGYKYAFTSGETQWEGTENEGSMPLKPSAEALALLGAQAGVDSLAAEDLGEMRVTLKDEKWKTKREQLMRSVEATKHAHLQKQSDAVAVIRREQIRVFQEQEKARVAQLKEQTDRQKRQEELANLPEDRIIELKTKLDKNRKGKTGTVRTFISTPGVQNGSEMLMTLTNDIPGYLDPMVNLTISRNESGISIMGDMEVKRYGSIDKMDNKKVNHIQDDSFGRIEMTVNSSGEVVYDGSPEGFNLIRKVIDPEGKLLQFDDVTKSIKVKDGDSTKLAGIMTKSLNEMVAKIEAGEGDAISQKLIDGIDNLHMPFWWGDFEQGKIITPEKVDGTHAGNPKIEVDSSGTFYIRVEQGSLKSSRSLYINESDISVQQSEIFEILQKFNSIPNLDRELQRSLVDGFQKYLDNSTSSNETGLKRVFENKFSEAKYNALVMKMFLEGMIYENGNTQRDKIDVALWANSDQVEQILTKDNRYDSKQQFLKGISNNELVQLLSNARVAGRLFYYQLGSKTGNFGRPRVMMSSGPNATSGTDLNGVFTNNAPDGSNYGKALYAFPAVQLARAVIETYDERNQAAAA